MAELRPPQDFGAALIYAPVSPVAHEIMAFLAYEPCQFGINTPRKHRSEDFMAIGHGHSNTAVYEAITELLAAKMIERIEGAGRRPSSYSVVMDPRCWVFPGKVHPCERFDVVPYRIREEPSVRPGGHNEGVASALADTNPPVVSALADSYIDKTPKEDTLLETPSSGGIPLRPHGPTSPSPVRQGKPERIPEPTEKEEFEEMQGYLGQARAGSDR